MTKITFPKQSESNPRIYAYEDSHPDYMGLLKVGYTAVDVEARVAQQYPTKRPNGKPYKIVFDESAMRNDGSDFSDHQVHKVLRQQGIENPNGEWFKCSVDDVKNAVLSVRNNALIQKDRIHDFPMRPEQEQAVEKTMHFINSCEEETPHFLWNAKMRFGKTFTAYQLAKKMGWKKVLVLTFKPAVQSAWEEDLLTHTDFIDWQFISKSTETSYDDIDTNKPFVWFASFQDFLGKNSAGGIKAKNEEAHAVHWDCVIFDEYHYGAWRESAKELFEEESKSEQDFAQGKGIELLENNKIPITTNAYLYLSGTPFKAMESGEFIEEQIYNWTYSDEQRAKAEWKGDNNPYEALPRMVLMTYEMPDDIKQVALDTEFNEFDLNAFFATEEKNDVDIFTYEDDVQKWLDLIRGAHLPASTDNLKLGSKNAPLPFSDVNLLSVLTHTFWFMPNVASCKAMKDLLEKPHNTFYNDYKVILSAGKEAGIGVEAIEPVKKAMGNPLATKTITLSCGKLTTGVSIKPWSGIFMLRNLKSPETYFQSAFRVQTPWTINNPDGTNPNKKEIIKQQCYVFDFAPNRALRQIADYSCRLDINESNPEKKVKEFINFLPVLAYTDGTMKQIDAGSILDMALSGTSATMLAKRWESALLVNVDNMTLSRLLASEDAMTALMSIEGFRSLNQEIETVISKSSAIKDAKEKASDKDLTKKEKNQLSEDEKEYKSMRKTIQEKLIKFATRIPIFMYLSDYRELCLKDVITELEPDLFKKVSGLSIGDFDLLVSLNVFNHAVMNDAVFKFKRYEDASLSYAGIEKLENKKVGGYDTVITTQEHKELYK